MRKLVPLTLLMVAAATVLVVADPAYAIGSFDVSDVVVTSAQVQFRIAGLDRTNDGDHGGYDGTVIYSNIYCSDTDTIVAVAPNTTGPWNVGDLVSYPSNGYDGSVHTGCYARIYTNGGLNDYQSRTIFSIPTAISPPGPLRMDPTFDADGTVVTSLGHDTYFGAMALQPDGKIVAVGNVSNGRNIDWRIGRYNVDGSVDSSFGGGGFVTRDFGDIDSLDAVAVQPDGKIVVGGYGRTVPGNAQWTVERFNANGSPDLGFGHTGLATSFPASTFSSNLLGLAIQADGKVVAVGYTRGDGLQHDDIAVARYNPDGSADASFGTGGTVTTGLNAGGTPNDRGNAVALQPDGKIVVLGDYDTGNHSDNVVLVRYHVDGSLDSSFDGDGIRTEAFLQHNGGRDVAVQPDGRIVITGGTVTFGSGDAGDTYVARYNADGSLDSTFGSGGKVIHAFVSGGADGANALAVQPDGKIVLAGYQQGGGADDAVVRRLNSNGTLDSSFGTNGSFVLGFNSGEDYLNGIALQPDGKIVVGGASSHDGTTSVTDWVLARLTEGPIEPTVTLTPSADTNVRSGVSDRNFGASDIMRIQSSGGNRALVRFDQSTLGSAVGGGTVLSARLRLTITDNGNNWGTTGRTVDIHRLLSNWVEGNGTETARGTGSGATWNCANDGNVANQARDCTGADLWEMGQPANPTVHPWAQTPTDTITVTNGQTGIVEFDVTQDVINFLAGTGTNDGWLIKKTNEGQAGQVSFGTRESPTGAELIVTLQP